jgi:hypothetical protein
MFIRRKGEGEKVMDTPKCEVCDNFTYSRVAKDEKGFDYHPNCLRKKEESLYYNEIVFLYSLV